MPKKVNEGRGNTVVKYMLDLDRIFKYVFETEERRDKESEITEIYMRDEDKEDMILNTKQLREIKNSDISQRATIKYDLLKAFMETTMEIDVSGEVPWTLGESLVFNTMFQNGFIKEVKDE